MRQMFDYTENFRNCQRRSIFFVNWNRQLAQNFKCTICNNVFIEPIQTDCGCRFCYNCIENYINNSNKICPNCGLELCRNNFVRDKAVEKDIFNLQIKCLNEGCNEIILLKELKNHFEICPYRSEQCDQCQQSYKFKFKQQHVTKLCGILMVTCNDCSLQMTRNNYENKHKNIETEIDNLCDKWIDVCPYRCVEDIKFEIKKHLNECSCKKIKCPLYNFGCNTITTVNEINRHLHDDIFQHQKLMMNEVVLLRKENHNLKKLLESTNHSLIEEVKTVKDLNKELLKIVENLQGNQSENNLNIANIKSEINQYKQLIVSSSLSKDNQLNFINGEFIWNISNIRQKINDAKLGNQLQIISDSFYSSESGYRLRLKIYPNGDGRGKDKYLSIYFMIVKGNYDNQIPWPFQQKVSLSILSNNSSRQNITMNMKPDNNEGCYGKPMTNSNVGAGQPEFIKLSELLTNHDYLHGMSLKIAIKISPHNVLV